MVSKGIERQGGHQGLQIRVMPTDERKLAKGAAHHDIRNPWSQPHNLCGDMATNRTHPDFTEQDIHEINLNFQPTQPGEEITSVERGGSGIGTVDSRSWI